MPNGHTWGGTCSLLCFTACPPVSVPMETKQAVPDQQQSLNFIPTLWCPDQTPQYSYSLMISCDFYQQKCELKGAILSSCHGQQEGPQTHRLPNYMCLSFHYALAPISGLSHLLCWTRLSEIETVTLWLVSSPWGWGRWEEITNRCHPLTSHVFFLLCEHSTKIFLLQQK